MKSHLGFPLALCITVASFFIAPTVGAISADDQAARDTALRWVILIDSGHYGQAFEQQAPRIKAGSMGKDFFVKWMNTRRVPVGRARTRAFLKVVHYHKAIGWPDGDYQQIAFKTSFDHKAAAVESVVLTKETGHWQPASYKLY